MPVALCYKKLQFSPFFLSFSTKKRFSILDENNSKKKKKIKNDIVATDILILSLAT